MARNHFSVKVNLPINIIWKLLRNLDGWLPYIPGYIHHEILNSREMIVRFKSKHSFIPMEHHIKITFVNWNEPSRLKLHVKDMKGNWMGYGVIETRKLNNRTTELKGEIEVKGKGASGKIIEAYVSKHLSELTDELIDSLLKKLDDGIIK